jgi:hypothetical protein
MCPPDDLHSSIELVRRAIQDRLTGHCPTIDAIAQALHMSSLGCRSATEREQLQCREDYSKTYGPLCGYGNTEPSSEERGRRKVTVAFQPVAAAVNRRVFKPYALPLISCIQSRTALARLFR